MSGARFAKPWMEERTDGHDPQSGQRQGRLAGRPLGAAPRRPRQGHRPRRIHPHHAACRACCMPSCSAARVAHGKIKSIDTSAAKKLPGVLHVVTVDDVMKVLPSPYYGPAFHDQPILAHEKVRFVGEPVAAVIATDPHIAEQAVQLITAEYEELPAVYDEVDALTSKVYVHDQLKPAGTFADLKHLKDAKNTNLALDYRLRRGDFDKAYAAAAHKFEHEFKTQKVLHLSFEPFACIADYKDTHVTLYDRLAGAVVRAHRDRPPARLAGEQGAGQGAVSRLGLRLQALHQARGAGARALHDRAQAREDRLHLRGDVLPDHPASLDVPHQERRRQGRQDRRAQMRGVLERRRLCRHRPARDAEVGPHRLRPLRHRQRRDRFLRALHQRDAVRRAARLRRAAARVGLRGPHRHDGAGAEDRSGGVPPQEPDARRRPAHHRPGAEGRAGRKGDGQGAGADELVAAVRQGQRHGQARPRLCHRDQGRDLADHLGRDRQRLRRRLAPRSIAAPSTWARAPTPRWRRWSAKYSTSRPSRCGSCRATPT